MLRPLVLTVFASCAAVILAAAILQAMPRPVVERLPPPQNAITVLKTARTALLADASPLSTRELAWKVVVDGAIRSLTFVGKTFEYSSADPSALQAAVAALAVQGFVNNEANSYFLGPDSLQGMSRDDLVCLVASASGQAVAGTPPQVHVSVACARADYSAAPAVPLPSTY